MSEGRARGKEEALVTPGDGLGLDAGAVDVELAAMAGEGDVPGFTFMDEREGLLLRVEFEEG